MTKIKKIICVALCVLLVIAFAACSPQAEDNSGRYDVLFGASSTTGMAYRWITTVCDLINMNSDILTASAITTMGSSENINLLAINEVDLCSSTAIVANTAALGQADWTGKPIEGLNFLAYMYDDYCYFCVAEDSEIRSFADLKGKRVSIGEKGGGLYTGMVQVLQALGLTEDNYFKPYYLSLSDSASAVIDGSIDAICVYGSANNSALAELKASRAGMRVFAFTAEEIQTICENNSILRPVTMMESYTGIPPVDTVGGGMGLYTMETLPPEVSYELCRILDTHYDELVAQMSQAEPSTMENIAATKLENLPTAEGSLQYLRDNGYLNEE